MKAEDQILKTKQWFQEAVPSPDYQNMQVQLGVHFEEVGEMLEEMKGQCPTSERAILKARHAVNSLAALLKDGVAKCMIRSDVALLDSLCDQIVTGIGVAHMMHYDISGAMCEVNRANYSKFNKDGKAVFLPNGKLSKDSANYLPPELSHYVL